MAFFFNTFFYDPLLNLLVLLYKSVAFQDLGLAIIFLTVLIRIILFPLFQKSAKYQIVMQGLQPKVAQIQKQFKENKTKQTEALMALYKENKTNPFSGFVFLILQLPILIALYQIFLNILKPEVFTGLYRFISAPEVFNTSFLGLINLADPNIIVVGLAALGQYFQIKTSLPKDQDPATFTPQEKMNRRMAFIAPLLTLFIFYNLPAAVSLYWLTASIFSVVQQELIQKKLLKEKNGAVGNIH
ncbi:MAG: YidC/Oxa1 family membrane protein insertase [Candidatus Liptonbacteria bacterium]|nr:YidC/Oxa1 family membrane protein insertase [Candidatus Liptonbacteria bacterium]